MRAGRGQRALSGRSRAAGGLSGGQGDRRYKERPPLRTASVWIVWRHMIALMDPLQASARQPFQGAAETATGVWPGVASSHSGKLPELPVSGSDVRPMRRIKARRALPAIRMPSGTHFGRGALMGQVAPVDNTEFPCGLPSDGRRRSARLICQKCRCFAAALVLTTCQMKAVSLASRCPATMTWRPDIGQDIETQSTDWR